MMIDSRIKALAEQREMIKPFVDKQVREGVISYGLSSFGYDMRVSNVFKIFTPSTGSLEVVDPKLPDPRSMIDFLGDVCIIPPNSFALAVSVERFKIPRNVMALCVGKSTYARVGVITNLTPFEPGWEGYVTIEISNTTPLPAKIYAYEGIAQVIFFENDFPSTAYSDRQGGGKYQNQLGITLAQV